MPPLRNKEAPDGNAFNYSERNINGNIPAGDNSLIPLVVS